MSLLKEMFAVCETFGIEKELAYSTLALYVDLAEVRKAWDVSWECNQELKLLYCKGRREDLGPQFIYIPVSNSSSLSMAQIEHWQNKLNCNEITLAIRASDSTCVYYEVSKGLVKPKEATELKSINLSMKNRKLLLMEAVENSENPPVLTATEDEEL